MLREPRFLDILLFVSLCLNRKPRADSSQEQQPPWGPRNLCPNPATSLKEFRQGWGGDRSGPYPTHCFWLSEGLESLGSSEPGVIHTPHLLRGGLVGMLVDDQSRGARKCAEEGLGLLLYQLRVYGKCGDCHVSDINLI